MFWESIHHPELEIRTNNEKRRMTLVFTVPRVTEKRDIINPIRVENSLPSSLATAKIAFIRSGYDGRAPGVSFDLHLLPQ